MLRVTAAATALVLTLGACGGEGDEATAADVPQPTASCADAFAAAVPPERRDAEAIEATPDSQQEANAEPDSATATLVRLEPTLQECDSSYDWLAGARSALPALPSGMDRLAALRQLCGEAAEAAPAPCKDLTPTDY